MTKTTLAILLLLSGSAVASDKVDQFASAIAHAEGFGRPHTIPSRYHNPGDLKAWRCNKQIRTGKAGHVIYKSDAEGWNALRGYITKMLSGNSHHYNSDMTFQQVAKVYAGNWRPWVKIVSKELGVTPETRLSTYFRNEDVPAPTVYVPADSRVLTGILHVEPFVPAPVLDLPAPEGLEEVLFVQPIAPALVAEI